MKIPAKLANVPSDEDVTNNNPKSSNKTKTHFVYRCFSFAFPPKTQTKFSPLVSMVFRPELGHSIGEFAALFQPLRGSDRLCGDEEQ